VVGPFEGSDGLPDGKRDAGGAVALPHTGGRYDDELVCTAGGLAHRATAL
jgi:hypothetical protein